MMEGGVYRAENVPLGKIASFLQGTMGPWRLFVSMRWPFLFLTLPLYALDQLSKWLVLQHIPKFSPIEVIPGFFNLVHAYNTGMAFGLMRNNNAFFIGLSFVALIGLLIFAWRGAFQGVLPGIGVWLMIAGILGNLTDRLIHGHVIDFLEFYVVTGGGVLAWPAFNVADSCICVAAACFVLSAFLAKPERKIELPAESGRGGSFREGDPNG